MCLRSGAAQIDQPRRRRRERLLLRLLVPEVRADRLNEAIVVALHESGVAAPSTTTVDGKVAIRAAIVNHRTGTADVDRLVDAVLQIGERTAARAGL